MNGKCFGYQFVFNEGTNNAKFYLQRIIIPISLIMNVILLHCSLIKTYYNFIGLFLPILAMSIPIKRLAIDAIAILRVTTPSLGISNQLKRDASNTP